MPFQTPRFGQTNLRNYMFPFIGLSRRIGNRGPMEINIGSPLRKVSGKEWMDPRERLGKEKFILPASAPTEISAGLSPSVFPSEFGDRVLAALPGDDKKGGKILGKI